LAGDEDFLRAFDYEISALVLRAFAGFLEEGGGLSVEDTATGMEENRYLE
jgi:hypothetical protein